MKGLEENILWTILGLILVAILIVIIATIMRNSLAGII